MLAETSRRHAEKLVKVQKAYRPNVGRKFVSKTLQGYEDVKVQAAGISNESSTKISRKLDTELENQHKPDILCRTCCQKTCERKNVESTSFTEKLRKKNKI